MLSSVSRVSSCGQTPMRARICGPCVAGSMPRMRSSPRSAATPRRPCASSRTCRPRWARGTRRPPPARTSRSIPRTASKSPYDLRSPLAHTSDVGSTGVRGVVVPDRFREGGGHVFDPSPGHRQDSPDFPRPCNLPDDTRRPRGDGAAPAPGRRTRLTTAYIGTEPGQGGGRRDAGAPAGPRRLRRLRAGPAAPPAAARSRAHRQRPGAAPTWSRTRWSGR